MKGFLAKHSEGKTISGDAFSTVREVKKRIEDIGEENVIDSTLGVLYDENKDILTFNSIWKGYDSLERSVKASYAESMIGNSGFLKAVDEWVFQGIEKEFYTSIIASAGGSGALSNTIWNYLDKGETLLLPEICWGSYKLMADEFSLKVESYKLFDEKDNFNLNSFFQKAEGIMEKEGKVFAIINDPCHNPTGYSMTENEWKELIQRVNQLSKKGPVIILNDIAYLDFAFGSLEKVRSYMKYFNDIAENVLIVQTFSMSKSFTSYGLRVGAQIGICKSNETLKAFKEANEFSCRAKWSNVSNGGMEILSILLKDKELLKEYIEERDQFVELLKERSEIFIEVAAKYSIPIYPYKEGFFITIPVEKNRIDSLHEELKDRNIFTIKQPKGLRVALCCLSKKSIKEVVKRIADILRSELEAAV